MDVPRPPADLGRYVQKRDFSRTPEPPPTTVHRVGPLTFTIQKHAARRLHYDFRLEIGGVLVSFPIPKGPSYRPQERRLAIQTEDHPYEYGTFEGVIPSPQYGGGQVIVWDAGTYTVIQHDTPLDFGDRSRLEALASEGLDRGHLSLFLNGRKLKGGWTLLRTRGKGLKSQWLFLKRRDGLERPDTDITLEDRSVLSGLSIADLEQGLLPRRPASQLAPTAEHVERARRLAFPSPYEPMLPTPSHTVPQSTNWLYEAELAGSRVLAFVNHGKVHLRSRGDCYPEIVRTLAALPVDQAVFDGEVVTGLKYDVFDLLYLDGFDLRSVPLTERKLLLHGVLAPLGGLEEVGVFDDGTQLRQAAQQQGLEGIVAKKRDSVYEAGARVRTWLTVKTSIPTRDRYTCAAR